MRPHALGPALARPGLQQALAECEFPVFTASHSTGPPRRQLRNLSGRGPVGAGGTPAPGEPPGGCQALPERGSGDRLGPWADLLATWPQGPCLSALGPPPGRPAQPPPPGGAVWLARPAEEGGGAEGPSKTLAEPPGGRSSCGVALGRMGSFFVFGSHLSVSLQGPHRSCISLRLGELAPVSLHLYPSASVPCVPPPSLLPPSLSCLSPSLSHPLPLSPPPSPSLPLSGL